jgi:hypothetical protein
MMADEREVDMDKKPAPDEVPLKTSEADALVADIRKRLERVEWELDKLTQDRRSLRRALQALTGERLSPVRKATDP